MDSLLPLFVLHTLCFMSKFPRVFSARLCKSPASVQMVNWWDILILLLLHTYAVSLWCNKRWVSFYFIGFGRFFFTPPLPVALCSKWGKLWQLGRIFKTYIYVCITYFIQTLYTFAFYALYFVYFNNCFLSSARRRHGKSAQTFFRDLYQLAKVAKDSTREKIILLGYIEYSKLGIQYIGFSMSDRSISGRSISGRSISGIVYRIQYIRYSIWGIVYRVQYIGYSISGIVPYMLE